VNISLDTLDPERFRTMTRRGRLEDALAGIEAARRVGMNPVKINMVVVRGLNDDEIVRFARLSRDDGWHIRYIEMMPVGPRGVWQGNGHYSVSDIQARIVEALGHLEPASMSVGSGPARYYRLSGGLGTIGFISPVTSHFCGECNRLRLTADGRLRPCLLSDLELDLRSVLRSGADPLQVQAMIKDAIQLKPKQHHLDEHLNPEGRTMSQIGG
jgi:cyclic pyranopterin phosphate synthase